MKNLIVFLIFFLIVALVLSFQYAPCASPITYKIGEVDPRFNLSPDRFAEYATQAEQLWGYLDQSPLFKYDENSELTINLTFDERQELSNELKNLDNQISNERENLDPQIDEYKRLTKEFEQRVSSFNEKVIYWNSQGGAPPDEFENLKKEQDELNALAQKINDMGKRLNSYTSEFNTKVKQFNSTVDIFNNTIKLKPEEGIYDPEKSRIDIFFNTDEKILLHTIAHELGHSRGLNHVESNDSIMYSFSTQVTEQSTDDRNELSRICRKRSYYEVTLSEAKLVYEFLKELIKNRLSMIP